MSGNALDRRKVVAAILKDRGDLLVIGGLGSSAYDMFAAGDHDANFYLWGAMGGAAMIGLGLGLAQPDRPVLVITGDGEQLMGMGGLATIGVSAPKNLTVVVLNNARYGETGMQDSHTAGPVDLVTVAGGCGFPDCRRITTMDDLALLRGDLHAGAGPVFADISIAAVNAPKALPPRDGVHLKNRFRAVLGIETI